MERFWPFYCRSFGRAGRFCFFTNSGTISVTKMIIWGKYVVNLEL